MLLGYGKKNKLRTRYSEIDGYLWSNRFWCAIAILLTAELLVYHCLNTPPDSSYEQYVAQTMPQYNGQFWFIAIENSKAMLHLILLGLIPCGLGVLFGTHFVMYSLVSTAKYILTFMDAEELVVAVLPHSLPEISAILLSIMIAALLSKTVTQFLIGLVSKRRRKGIQTLAGELLQISKTAILVGLPLIWVSAFIEAVISANLVC